MDAKDGNVIFDNSQPDGAAQNLPAQPAGDQQAPLPEAASEIAPEPLQPPPPPPSAGPSKKIIIIGAIALVLVLLVLIFVFIPKRTEVRNVKLVWWGLWEDSRVMQPLIVDYRKTHPNIQIDYIKQTPQEYRERLIARIKNGSNAPDIFRFHNTWVPMLTEVLLPLSSDVISPEEFKKNYYPVMQTDLVRNGAIYGIPMGADSLALFVNTTLLKKAGVEPPKNWEHDFIITAQKLTQRDENGKIKVAGAALGTYSPPTGNITHASDIISLLFAQQGVDMQNFNNPDKEQGALSYYINFALPDKANGVWDSTLDESMLAFAEGKLAMYFGYSWDVFDIKNLNSSLNFEVHPVPSLLNRKITIASYWVEGVSSKSPNQKEALEFMHYLAQKETAQKFYNETAKVRAFGEPYARVDLAETLKDNPLAYPFVSQLPNAKSTIFSGRTWDGETGMNTRANGYLANTITAIRDDVSGMDTEIEKLNSGLSQIFADYGIQQQ
jgi:ABC-type glycerol-3-phosphate transport system substrate-binding protein